MATFEPGASDVFTHGFDVSPFATAFCASRPAASITLGFDVFVQDVIAAITTWPCCRLKRSSLYSQGTPPSLFTGLPSETIVAAALPAGVVAATCDASCAANASRYIALLCDNGTRSCGRFGPARLGTTVVKSSSSVSVKTGSGVASVRKSPCSFVNASTRATCSSLRPERCKYLSVSSSTGKKPIVAPYSGAMLAMVARSASASDDKPDP